MRVLNFKRNKWLGGMLGGILLLSCSGAMIDNAVAAEAEKKDQPHSFFQIFNERVSLSALIEIEAYSLNGYEDTNENDIELATVELGLKADVTDWVSGGLELLYEEGGEDDVELEEAYITLGNTEVMPLSVTAGRIYVPFGVFETNMIQDPLTLAIGETNDTAVQVNLEANGLVASVFGFSGDVTEAGSDSEINTFGASLAYAMENDSMSIDVGVDYINNISVAGDIPDFVPEEIQEYVSGIAAHATFATGPFTLIGEYVAALDEYATGDLDFGDNGAKPQAYNLEAGYTTEIAGKETTFALGYQKSNEAVALELPETRYLTAVSVEIFEYTSLTLEYLHDKDYSESDGGTGEEADQISFKLALEF